MRGLILTLEVLVCVCGSTYAEWMDFNAGCAEGSSPSIRFGETAADRISFDVELSGLLAEIEQYDSDDYLRFNSSPGTVVLERPGFPEVPHVTCFVAVPDGVDLDLSCTRTCLKTVSSLPVYPAPLDSLVHEEGISFIKEFFTKDPGAYTSTQWFPAETASLVGEFRLRDQRVAVVDVFPVQYLASEDSLRVWEDIAVTISFENGNPVWCQTGLGHYDSLIGDRLIGYRPSTPPMVMSPPPGSVFRHENTLIQPLIVPDYVIIVAPGLDGQHVDDFASYRASLNGFDILIANIEDINAGYGTSDYYFISPEIIRDYTEALWNWSSPENRPTYLLLIGDHDYPGCTSYSYCLPTKEYESTVGEGNDGWLVLFDEPRENFSGLPDMIVGRLPVRDTDTLEDMFNLIEAYESSATPPYPANLQNRRYLTRLAGTDHEGSFTQDDWQPSVEWTTSLCNWMGYSLDNYYCGDGEDTQGFSPPNADGSEMTSQDWIDACTDVFERGSHAAFYSDHGDFHMFSAGLNWGIAGLGARDSTFDDDDVMELAPDPDHWFPFILMLCCSSGTFNHTIDEHETVNQYQSLCYNHGAHPPYDFLSDCFAEDFILNTDCGAIGVFAGSNASSIGSYIHYGEGMLSAVYEKGITRTGDAILSARLQRLDSFYSSGEPRMELAQFNLLGDPALDIGDRMKFRDHCDLIVCPSDIEMNAYPTMSVNDASRVTLSAKVRNAGWLSASPFSVTMEVSDGSSFPDVLTARCNGLAPGEETIIEFLWNNTWFTPPDSLYLEVSVADPGGQTPDSWMPNNSAEIALEIIDFYPNEDGWPVPVGESVVVPPALCDFDGNSANGLEIVLTTRFNLLVFADESPLSPIWESISYQFFIQEGPSLRTTIPVTGNVFGDNHPEIVIDCKDDLLVFNRTSADPVASLAHSEGWFWGLHSVSLGDFVSESDLETRDEIVLIRDNELSVVDVVGSSLVPVRTVQLPGIPPEATNIASWSVIQDINGDGTPEIIVRAKWNVLALSNNTKYFVYDYAANSFVSQREWSNTIWPTIPAVGGLPGGDRIAIPTNQSTYTYNPTWLVDPANLSTEQGCTSNPNLDSDHVPYCVMADWEAPFGQADRILANTENQCFAWNSIGRPASGYPREYSSRGTAQPPFPGLGELDNQDTKLYTDVLVATTEGVIFGIASDGDPLNNLGFPYNLPSSIQGGFAIADIDMDEKVEVVFGTMDNYLHVWELGNCTSGYAPWPQCQHDAARTGVLVE